MTRRLRSRAGRRAAGIGVGLLVVGGWLLHGSATAAQTVDVRLVTGGSGAIDVGQPFATVSGAIEDRIDYIVAHPPGSVDLVLPGLSALGEVALGQAVVDFPATCVPPTSDCLEVVAELPLQELLAEVVADVSFDYPTLPLEIVANWETGSIQPVLDLRFGDADTTLRVDEVVALAEALFPGLGAAASLGADLELEGTQVAFRFDPAGDDHLDVTASTEVGGGIVLGGLLSATAPAVGDPYLVVGFRADSTLPGATTIELGGLLQIPGGSTLAAELTLPELALGSAFPVGVDVRPACPPADPGCIPLRPLALEFFDDPTDPDDGAFTDPVAGDAISFGTTLQLGAVVELDSFGDDVQQVFGYDDGARAILLGELGVTVADLAAGSFSLDSVQLDMQLPVLDGSAATLLPQWLAIDDAAIDISYDAGALQIGATASVTVDVPDDSQPSGAFEAQFDVSASMSRSAVGDLSVDVGGVSTNEWAKPYGIEWLTLTGVGASLHIDVPAGATPATVVAELTASFAVPVGASTQEFTVTLTGTTSPLALQITMSLDTTITLTDVLDAIGVPVDDLPTNFTNSVSVGPASITVRITDGAGGLDLQVTFGATGSIPITANLDLDGELFFGFETGAGADPAVTFGVRTSSLSLTDLIGSDPLGLGDLPSLGLVGRIGGPSTDGMVLDAPMLTPEARSFFAAFGCTDDPSCDFRLDLEPGLHILAALAVPDGLTDITSLFWMNPDSPSLLDLSIPFPGAGEGFDLTDFELALSLPEIVPPDEIDFISRGRLSVEVSPADLSLALVGEMDIRFRDDSVTPAATLTKPADCIRSWLPTVRSQSGPTDERACFQELTLGVLVEISLDGPPQLAFEGSLTTPSYGWPSPFGLDFLSFTEARLRVDVTFNVNGPSFGFGVLAAGSVFDKDFSGSLAVGFSIVPAPPPTGFAIVPEFRGIRFASQAGIGTDDLIALYDVLDLAADFEIPDPLDTEGLLAGTPDMIQVKDLIGLDPPPSEQLVDELSLPSLSFRNIEFMLGLADIPSLCIEPGLKMAGELYIDGKPAGPIAGSPPPACTPGPPVVDPTACSSDNGCFASFVLNVTLDGIILSGSVGSFDLPPVLACEQTVLDLRLTLTVQRFLLSAGCDVSVLGSGSIEIRVGLDGLAFAGEMELFPDAPGLAFSALVEGQLGVNIDEIDLTDPETLLGAGDVELHLVLQSDFVGAMGQAVEPLLQALRTAGIAIDDVLTQLETSGDPLAVLLDLPDTLEDLGAPVPAWLGGLADDLEEFRSTLEFYGVPMPTINKVLGGFDVTLPGILGVWSPEERECRRIEFGVTSPLRGVVVDGKCWTDEPDSWLGGEDGNPGRWIERFCWAAPLVEGTVIGDDCWSIPPTEIHIPGLSEMSGGAVAPTLAGVIAQVEDLLEPIIAAFPGVPNNFDLGDFRTGLVDLLREADSPLFALSCVDVRYTSFNGAPGSALTLRMDLVLLGQERGLDVTWDFSQSPSTQVVPVAEAIFGQLFLDPQPHTCQPFGITTIAGSGGTGGVRGDPFDRDFAGIMLPPTDFTLAVDPGSVTEGSVDGDVLSATVTLNRVALAGFPVTVVVDWGDGTTSEVVITSGTTGTATHRYADDAPSGTDADSVVVTATGLDKTRTAATTVANAEPTVVEVSLTRSAEGSAATLSGSFTDIGLLDSHQVTVKWGDGTTTVADLTVGDRSFELTHIYADDDPAGTSSDTYSVRVDVTDDDLGFAREWTSAVVDNVAPSGTSIVPVFDVADPDPRVNEDGRYDYLVTWSDPGAEDRYTLVVTWGDGSTTTVTVLAPVGTGPAPRSALISHRYLDDNPTATPSDDVPLSVTVADDDLGLVLGSHTVRVHNVEPRIASVDTDDDLGVVDAGGAIGVTVQYSDPIAEGAGVGVVVRDVAGDALVATLEAVAGSESLIGQLTVAIGSCTVSATTNTNTCPILIGSTPSSSSGIYTDVAPGAYALDLVVTDDDTGVGRLRFEVTVLPEDAMVWYHGPLFVATESAATGSATVELRATIRDVTSVPDHPAWDPWPGDIRNANLAFSDRDTSAERCAAGGVDEVFEPFDVFVAERSIGVGSCDWFAVLGTRDAFETQVATVAGGYYVRDETADDVVVTVSRPLADFITGGGFLLASDSAGVYASDDGTHANFGLHVKFNKKLTNLQGGVNLIIRSGGRVYQIKSNSMTSLGIRTVNGVLVAEFETKANITDVTVEGAPVAVGGNFTLQMRMTDRSATGAEDSISFALWDIRTVKGKVASQLLLYSSRWNGNLTLEQTMSGGNVMVHRS